MVLLKRQKLKTLTAVRRMKITPILLPPPQQLGIKVTASHCITKAHCHHTTIFSNGPRISTECDVSEGQDFMDICVKTGQQSLI
jgi:hypothetical protein